jgi:SAM-dependent methyltransferase
MSTQGKRFATSLTREDLDRVNDAQKGRFEALVRERGGDTYLAERSRVYGIRWAEALVYIADRSRVLDIGGGWIPEPILRQLLHTRRLDYHYMDIDAHLVIALAQELRQANLSEDHAVVADNTVIPFPDQYFDAVFSSHCLEHSLDLAASFAEIRRALVSGGTLFMAVPFGFDDSDEHMYFFEIDEWAELLDHAGFEVLNTHIGKVYAYPYHDVALVARRRDQDPDLEWVQKFASDHCKRGSMILDCDSELISYPSSAAIMDNGFVVVRKEDGPIVVRQPPTARLDHVICARHDWSGVIEFSGNSSHRLVTDCYSREWHPSAVHVGNMSGDITIKVVGQNPLSKGAQVALRGLLLKE